MYTKFVVQMKEEKIIKAPVIYLLFIFIHYNIFFIFVLITILSMGKVSVATYLFFIYLIVSSPLIAIVAYKNYKNQEISKYHLWTYNAGVSYFLIVCVIFIIIPFIFSIIRDGFP